MDRGGTISYYHTDALGSIQSLSDSSGNLVEFYQYVVYGQFGIRDPSGNVRTASAYGNRFYFTGREFDTETSLYYNRARYYDPRIRRFLQRDPVGYTAGINLYSYVGNNPVNFADPLGWEKEPSSLILKPFSRPVKIPGLGWARHAGWAWTRYGYRWPCCAA